jgi:hypothetical protein
MDRVLARVVQVFGASQLHHAYVFANRQGTWLKVLMYGGFGVWPAARRLHQGSPSLACVLITPTASYDLKQPSTIPVENPV